MRWKTDFFSDEAMAKTKMLEIYEANLKQFKDDKEWQELIEWKKKEMELKKVQEVKKEE